MSDYPDGTDYADVPDHPNADLFRDIPIAGDYVTVKGKRGKPDTRLWRATRPGVIALPMSASRIAEHAELVGMVLDPERAQIKRINPLRGGLSITSPGRWIDINAPEPPPVDPVVEVAAKASQLTAPELLALREHIDSQIEGLQ